jgi:uncharacterized protein with HEPN domain
VTRSDSDRLADILGAIDAISVYTTPNGLRPGVTFDAVRMRLVEIGEAVGGITTDLLEQEPDIPWRQIKGMRNFLAHQYFDSLFGEVKAVLDHHLAPLRAAVLRLHAAITPHQPATQDDDTNAAGTGS